MQPSEFRSASASAILNVNYKQFRNNFFCQPENRKSYDSNQEHNFNKKKLFNSFKFTFFLNSDFHHLM